MLFSFLIILLSSILSNLVAMVIVASLTIVACKNLNLDPKPYIFAEAIFANVGGLMTLISSVPNILVSLAAGITFLEFLAFSIPLSIIITGVTFQVLIKILKIRKPLFENKKIDLQQKIQTFDEWSIIKDKKTFYRIIAIMAITLMLLVIGDFVGIGLGLIAILGGAIMILISKVNMEKIFKRIDWNIIFFVSALLILVGGLSEAGVLKTFSEPLIQLASSNLLVAALIILWTVGLLSSVIVDIPLTAAFVPIIHLITDGLGSNSIILWWAIIFGVALGANYTPIGSSSTIIALGVLRKQQEVSFKEFSKVGTLVCTFQLVMGSLYLIALYFIIPT